MRRIIDYKCVRISTQQKISVLNESVSKLLKEGWELYGDTRVSASPYGSAVIQAMVKYDVR